MKHSWDDVISSKKGRQQVEFPDDVRKALARIGRTEDGKKLTLFLYNAYIFASPPSHSQDGAFQEFAATHRLARRILILLQGDLNDRPNGPNSGQQPRDGWLTRCLRAVGVDYGK